MKLWLQRKSIRSAARSVPACILALSVLNSSPVFAADKLKYMPPMAPEVDSSANRAIAAPSGPPSEGVAGSSNSYTPTGKSDSAADEQIKSLLHQALERHNQGDAGGAQRLFNQVLTLDPNNSDANFNLGALAEEHHDLAGALHFYTAAARANPTDRDIADAVSSVQSQIRQQSAASQTEQQVQKKQHLAELGHEAAAAYKAGRYDEAIAKLQIVDKESPNDANTIFALGQAYRGKGDTQRAHEYLAKAAALAPNNQLFNATLNLNDGDGRGAGAQQADGMPPAAPDYHAHNAPQTPQRSRSDWQDEGWQSANRQDQPPPDDNGVRPFTTQGESQLQGSVANSGGMGRGIGMSGLGLGLGGAALGIGALTLFGMMRGGSSYGMQPAMPYGGMSPYSPYGYPGQGFSPYSPYNSPYRMMRMGRRYRW